MICRMHRIFILFILYILQSCQNYLRLLICRSFLTRPSV